MAQMFPSVIPDYVRSNPYREAEIDVYEQLQSQLPGSFRCYYSRPWLGLTASGEEKEGEADFVVAHPEHGFLVIEVKGGAVRRLEGSEQWISKNRLGITNNIKDPVKQASDSKHVLLKKLKDDIRLSRKFITARHGVILPNCSPPGRDLGPAMPLWLFAFSKDMDNLGNWVSARLANHEDGELSGNGLGSEGMKILHALLAGPVELRVNLQRSLRADKREIERLTRDQLDVLDSLEDHPQMSISGGAGTGKTLLALEKACRLAEQGQRVLVTCFNQPLGQYLGRVTGGYSGIVAANFHAACLALVKQSGGKIPEAATMDLFFRESLPTALVDALASNPDLSFDAVIVDEGQDFPSEWLTALRLCLKDPEHGQMYVFYDDNQKVYRLDGGWLLELPPSRFLLTRNMRNTKSIHDCSKPWYRSPRVVRASGPAGEPVAWREIPGNRDLPQAVGAILSELVGQHGVSWGDIAILTGASTENSPLVKGGQIAGAPFVDASQAHSGRLVFDTVRRFKGLDRPVVLLTEVGRLTDQELVYIALTRPSLLLYVLGKADELSRLRGGVS